MNVNKDFKAYIALAMLTLGLACTIVAIATDYWYQVKADPSAGLFTKDFSMKMSIYFGLWRVCGSVDVSSVKITKCLKVNELEEISKLSRSFDKLGNLDTHQSYKNQFQNNKQFIPGRNGRSKRDTQNPFKDLGDAFRNPGNNGDDTKDPWEHLVDTLGNLGINDATKNPWEANADGPGNNASRNAWNVQYADDSSDSSLGDDDVMSDLAKKLYPDYLKAIQAFEILAMIGGVVAITVWLVYIITSAMTRKGVASSVFKTVVIVLTIVIALFHLISALVWVGEKQKEKNDVSTAIGGQLPEGIKISYGWSWGMAILGAILHLLSIVPLVLTKADKLDDGMDHSLMSRTVKI